VRYFNGEHLHPGIVQQIPTGGAKPASTNGRVVETPVLGRIHHAYRGRLEVAGTPRTTRVTTTATVLAHRVDVPMGLVRRMSGRYPSSQEGARMRSMSDEQRDPVVLDPEEAAELEAQVADLPELERQGRLRPVHEYLAESRAKRAQRLAG
jgi:hypothetical protein